MSPAFPPLLCLSTNSLRLQPKRALKAMLLLEKRVLIQTPSTGSRISLKKEFKRVAELKEASRLETTSLQSRASSESGRMEAPSSAGAVIS